MTNIRLVLLGILAIKPMHGYEIKQIIEDHMGDWTDIKFGSIYFALSKMLEEGSLSISEEMRSGNRPARTVYAITDKGQNEYQRLLRELWTSESPMLYPLDIGVFFIWSLPREEASQYVDQRIKSTQKKLTHFKASKTELRKDPHFPPQSMAILDHSLLHMEAELTWLLQMKSRLADFY